MRRNKKYKQLIMKKVIIFFNDKKVKEFIELSYWVIGVVKEVLCIVNGYEN